MSKPTRGRAKATQDDIIKRKLIAENIKIRIKELGMTQKELSEKSGVPQNTLSRYMNAISKAKDEYLEKIAEALSVDVSYFELSLSPTTSQHIQIVVERLEERRRVIVLDTAQRQLDEQERAESHVSDIIYLYDYYDHPASAGTGQYLTDVAVEQIELPVEIDADFVIPISGDSMEPDYHDGDYIFVKLSVDLASGDIGVFDYEGDAYVKQLIIEDGQAHLHSLNPDYPDKPITPETTFRIIGKVVGSYTAE